MPSIRLGTAIVFAKDISRLAEFYADGLGLPVIDAPMAPGWIEFDAGGVRLARITASPPKRLLTAPVAIVVRGHKAFTAMPARLSSAESPRKRS